MRSGSLPVKLYILRALSYYVNLPCLVYILCWFIAILSLAHTTDPGSYMALFQVDHLCTQKSKRRIQPHRLDSTSASWSICSGQSVPRGWLGVMGGSSHPSQLVTAANRRTDISSPRNSELTTIHPSKIVPISPMSLYRPMGEPLPIRKTRPSLVNASTRIASPSAP